MDELKFNWKTSNIRPLSLFIDIFTKLELRIVFLLWKTILKQRLEISFMICQSSKIFSVLTWYLIKEIVVEFS